MAAPKLQPFKAKVEERTKCLLDSSESMPQPPKKACTAYEKQIQKMEGDTSLLKDLLHNVYIYIIFFGIMIG